MSRDAVATSDEIMVTAAAREIRNGAVCFIGTGLPMVAAYLAKYTHAPDAVFIFESGIVDPRPDRLAMSVGDFVLLPSAVMHAGLFDVLGLLQKGAIDLGFLGAAEVDHYGNINTTVIGDYFRPKVRLPGSGGANDIASLAKETVIIVRHEPRKFPRVVHYVTSPGFIDGPDGRAAAGLRGGGPRRIITDLAVLGFDPDSKRVKLETVHPGVTVDEVVARTGFELLVPRHIGVTCSPTKEEIGIIRRIDPTGIYVNRG